MDSLEADQTNAFLAVVETGSFAAAGRKIGRDSSVISRRVAALEARLGIRLLERSTRRVSATEAGTRFRDRVREALEMLHAAEDEARELAAAPAGLLRVSLPLGFGRMWIAPAMPEFLACYPAVRVEACYTDRYVDLIAEGFDAGVRIGKLDDSRLVARGLASMRRILCASPAYLASRPALTRPEDLQRHDCVTFTPLATHPVWHLAQAGAGPQGSRHIRRQAVRIAGRLITDDIQAVIQAALGGVGVVMATDWLVGPELADGRLVPVLPDWHVSGDEQISVVRASARLQPAKTRAFVDWIAAVIGAQPWRCQAR